MWGTVLAALAPALAPLVKLYASIREDHKRRKAKKLKEAVIKHHKESVERKRPQ